MCGRSNNVEIYISFLFPVIVTYIPLCRIFVNIKLSTLQKFYLRKKFPSKVLQSFHLLANSLFLKCTSDKFNVGTRMYKHRNAGVYLRQTRPF